MNIFGKAYCRIYQKTMKLLMHFIHIPSPRKEESLSVVPSLLKSNHCSHPILISGKHVSRSEEVVSLMDSLEKDGIHVELYTDITPDPTFACVESLFSFYREHHCDSILAIGGGSVLDAAKALGAKCVHPDYTLDKFKGVLKVGKTLPYFIAVPTTAGTGSEATLASVVTNEKTLDKFAINDPHLVPDVAVLDDALLKTLPDKMIAETGMDAFTHAIEAYLGHSSTGFTDEHALTAIRMIHENLLGFYYDSSNQTYRKNMLVASYHAGLAFTRAYVGYVHALAHAIGGKYHLSHGYSIAILLPYVLKAYGKTIDKKLAYLYDMLKLGDKKTEEEKADGFLSWLSDLERKLNIPTSFDGIIREEDIPSLAKHASREGNPFYPVPRELDEKELSSIIKETNG